MKWISVKDELPPIGKTVLVYAKTVDVYGRDSSLVVPNSFFLGHYCCTYGWSLGYAGTSKDRIALYWQFLPEKPNEMD